MDNEEISPTSRQGRAWKLQFVPDLEKYLVDTCQGKIAQTIGHSEAGKFYLSIPEAAYLIEHERATVDGEVINNLSGITKDDDRKRKAFSKLKDLGYILTSTSEQSWSIHQPTSSFRKSSPTEPTGNMVFADPDDPVPINSSDSFYYVSDTSSRLIMKLKWLDMDPDNLVEFDQSMMPTNESSV